MATFDKDLPAETTTRQNVAQRRRYTTLSGLQTDYAAPITSTDTILQAIGKLQAQINSTNSGITNTVPFTTVASQNDYTNAILANTTVVAALLDNTVLRVADNGVLPAQITKAYASDTLTYVDAEVPLENDQVLTIFFTPNQNPSPPTA